MCRSSAPSSRSAGEGGGDPPPGPPSLPSTTSTTSLSLPSLPTGVPACATRHCRLVLLMPLTQLLLPPLLLLPPPLVPSCRCHRCCRRCYGCCSRCADRQSGLLSGLEAKHLEAQQACTLAAGCGALRGALDNWLRGGLFGGDAAAAAVGGGPRAAVARQAALGAETEHLAVAAPHCTVRRGFSVCHRVWNDDGQASAFPRGLA